MRLEPLSIALDGAVPIPAGAIVAYLASHPRMAHDFVLDLADAILQEMDRLDTDPDLEDGADAEPNLGAPERGVRYSQSNWMIGCRDDLEEQCEDEGACIQSQPHDGHDVEDACTVDDIGHESSLGSLDRHIDQTGWAMSSGWNHDQDAELDRSDYEQTSPESFGKGFVRCAPDDHEDDDTEWVNGDGSDTGLCDNGLGDVDGAYEQWGGP